MRSSIASPTIRRVSSARCCRFRILVSGSSSCSPSAAPTIAASRNSPLTPSAPMRWPRTLSPWRRPTPTGLRSTTRAATTSTRSERRCCRSFVSWPESTGRWSSSPTPRWARCIWRAAATSTSRSRCPVRTDVRRTWTPCSTCTTRCSTPMSIARQRSCRSVIRSSVMWRASQRRRTSVVSTSCTARRT